MKLPSIILSISQQLNEHKAKAIVVGGSVRDHFLGIASKDYDIEVYGLKNMDELASILQEYGSVNLVGKSFGVLKLVSEGQEYDFSFPRLEQKIAKGHKGFSVLVDGSMNFKKAAKRRDFTVNAIGYDVLAKEYLDPYGGKEDIKNKILKNINNQSFTEDPLRVYRAVQFSARFDFRLTNETFDLCKKMLEDGMLDELPKQRVYVEFIKLLLKAKKPSAGFRLMKKLGIIEKYFPELHAIVGVPQSAKWHPEGDVWIHTMMTLDAMQKELELIKYKLEIADKQKLKFMFAILCHDLGKATHTSIEDDGRIRAIGHEEAGVEPTRNFLYRLTDEHDFIDSILPLVEHHLKPSQFYANVAKNKAIRKLATKVNIEELIIVAKADFLGRTTKESLAGVYHAGEWMMKKSKGLKVYVKPLDNLLQGRDLIDIGLEPSSEFKVILDEVYLRQLDGNITKKEEAESFVRSKYL